MDALTAGPSPAALLWSARRTVAQHEPGEARKSGCKDCTPSGCGRLAAAREVVSRAETDRPVTLADAAEV